MAIVAVDCQYTIQEWFVQNGKFSGYQIAERPMGSC
jgi:hypothetical protein